MYAALLPAPQPNQVFIGHRNFEFRAPTTAFRGYGYRTVAADRTAESIRQHVTTARLALADESLRREAFAAASAGKSSLSTGLLGAVARPVCREVIAICAARSGRRAARKIAEAARAGKPGRFASMVGRAGAEIEEFSGPRLRARRVNEDATLEGVIAKAVENPGKIRIDCDHGGGVANKYGYPAATEGVVCSALVYRGWLYARRVVGRLAANKVTHCGVASMAGLGAIFDRRTGQAAADAAYCAERNRLLATRPLRRA